MAQLRLYFHTSQSTCAIPAPGGANCNSLSETAPDLADTATSSISGGHGSLASAGYVQNGARSKPSTSEGTSVNTTVPPPTGSRLGWFSDQTYSGTFASGTWTFVERDDDDRAAIVGNPVLVLYACTTRDFTGTFRHLGTLDFSTQDWWTGGASNLNCTGTLGALSLSNEYVFCRILCHETSSFSTGKTLTLHQEGTSLADSVRMNILTTDFASHVRTVPLSARVAKTKTETTNSALAVNRASALMPIKPRLATDPMVEANFQVGPGAGNTVTYTFWVQGDTDTGAATLEFATSTAPWFISSSDQWDSLLWVDAGRLEAGSGDMRHRHSLTLNDKDVVRVRLTVTADGDFGVMYAVTF